MEAVSDECPASGLLRQQRWAGSGGPLKNETPNGAASNDRFYSASFQATPVGRGNRLCLEKKEKKSAWLLLRLCPVIICQHHSPSTTEGSIQACLAGGMTTRWGGVNGFFRERGEGYLLDVCLWIPWPASTLIRHCLHCRRMDVGRAWKGNGARWSRGSETGH